MSRTEEQAVNKTTNINMLYSFHKNELSKKFFCKWTVEINIPTHKSTQVFRKRNDCGMAYA